MFEFIFTSQGILFIVLSLGFIAAFMFHRITMLAIINKQDDTIKDLSKYSDDMADRLNKASENLLRIKLEQKKKEKHMRKRYLSKWKGNL